ncbi:MAG: hypothetical protein Kow0042_18680 [Calditrichia bacterium]
MERGEFQTALAQMDSAIHRKPGFAPFYYTKGRLFEFLNQPDSAITIYEDALKIKSHFPEVWSRLARLYLNRERYQKAVQILKKLVDIQPDSSGNYLLLAEAYLYAGQPRLALDQIQYYQKRGGDTLEVLRIKGLSFFTMKDYPKAVQLLEKYIQQKPNNYTVQKSLGIAYIQIGKLEKGISHLNLAMSIKRDDPEIFLYRAQYFLKRGKIEDAREQIKFATRLDSTNSLVLLEKGKFHLMVGDTATAEEALQKGVRLNPQCWLCYRYLGIISQEQNRPLDALRYFQTYMEHIYTRDPEVEQRLKALRKTEGN